MHPELFRIADVGFPAYFVLLLTGFFFAVAVQALMARRIQQSPDVMVDLGLAMLLCGVLGARLLHVLADGYFWNYVHMCTDPEAAAWPMERAECLASTLGGTYNAATSTCHFKQGDCWLWAKFWAGGLTYYGGFIGATLAAVWLLRRDRFPFGKAADLAGITVPLGLAFGRMGCLLGGCCFGARTDSWLGISFPPRSDASTAQWKVHELASSHLPSHPVHPTQVYESLAALGLSAFCMLYLWPRKRYDGHVFVAFVVLYAAARFAIEYLRRDDRGGGFGFSTSQWIGFGLAAVATAVHLRFRPKGNAVTA
jgi:phosphatidylglycerol---prolipoprotein diacylglyceryl transferase